MTALTYVYGVREHWARTLPAPVRAQLRLAHNLRNDLVGIWRDCQDKRTAVWSGYPQIASVEATITALGTEVADLARAAAQERSAARSRQATGPATTRLREVRAELKEARATRREAIGAARVAAGPALAALVADERALIKALYARYCQDGIDGAQLYWATYNDVVAQHKVAAERVAAVRAQGRAAQLRFHRWDGSGTIAVQLQRRPGAPARLPDLLRDRAASPSRNVLLLDDTDRRGSVRMRVTGGHHGETVTVPVTWHRPLPPEREIVLARLVVRRTAGHTDAAVHLVTLDPSPEETPVEPETGPVVALHLGWRRIDDGVQVATWRATDPVTVPAALREVVHAHTDRVGTVVLPAQWRDKLLSADKIRGGRDKARDQIRATLVEHLHVMPGTGLDGDGWPTASEAARWWSPTRFAALAIRWCEAPPAGREDVVTALEDWRRRDRRAWETEAHGRARALRRRDDAYARVAAWLVKVAARVVVDDTAVVEVARDQSGSTEQPTAPLDAVGQQRMHAAPGSLRARLVGTATRERVPVQVVPQREITLTHYACGHVHDPATVDLRQRVITCAGCGQGFDQDLSATLMMLAASGTVPPAGVRGARDMV